MKLFLFATLVAAAALTGTSHAQSTITLGETNKLGYADSDKAGLLLADGPFNLAETATLDSLSFWVTNAAGQLILGIYTSGPNNNCAGGTLQAQTAAFTPKKNSWNTAAPNSSVTLSPGNYCLAYMPSNKNLSFLKGMTSGIGDYWYPYNFGSMPETFSSSPSGPDGFHWSLYATLTPTSAPPTLSVTITPSPASVPANAAVGTVVATLQASWSNGAPFTGTYLFTSPYGSDGGAFAISGNSVVVNDSLSIDAATSQEVTVEALQ
jgi:hypothetical protein